MLGFIGASMLLSSILGISRLLSKGAQAHAYQGNDTPDSSGNDEALPPFPASENEEAEPMEDDSISDD